VRLRSDFARIAAEHRAWVCEKGYFLVARIAAQHKVLNADQQYLLLAQTLNARLNLEN
jgi:hypothetical protein